jgi:SAM-dependent methyltransferase
MREITLPPVHNKRSPAQWEIIRDHVCVYQRTVLDLGCGYADLLWFCWHTGAQSITGVDYNVDIIEHNNKIAGNFLAYFICQDIVDFTARFDSAEMLDIILCFSVLPYLDDILGTLKWIREHSRLAFIECQLYGDGPGPEFIKGDGDMWALLNESGWKSIAPIGTTYIPDRDKHRTIWMCKS